MQVQVLESNGYVIAEGSEEIAYVECLEFAKTLPGRYSVEYASEWFMEEGLEGFVILYSGTVQAQVSTITEARLYLSQQETPAEEEGEIILEALDGVKPATPRKNSKAARCLAALAVGATEAEIDEIIGEVNAPAIRLIKRSCRQAGKSFGCRYVNGKYYLIRPAA